MGIDPDPVDLFSLSGIYRLGPISMDNYQANDIALDIYLTIQLVSMNSGAVTQPIPLALNLPVLPCRF